MWVVGGSRSAGDIVSRKSWIVRVNRYEEWRGYLSKSEWV